MDVPQDFEFFDAATATATPTDSTSWTDDLEFTYDDYVPSTVDPDWWFTIMIIAGCLLLHFSLPLWIYFGQRMGFHKRHEDKNGSMWIQTNDQDTPRDGLLKQLDDARSVISGYSHSHAPGGSYGSPISVISGSVAMSRAGTHLGILHSPGDMHGGDTASVFSGTSNFTDALFMARPKRTPHARRQKSKRIVSTKSCVDGDDQSVCSVKKKLDVRMAAEFKKAEMAILRNNRGLPLSSDKHAPITPNTTSSDVDYGSAFDDNRSEAAPSILSKLDADAISVRDAVDARDGSHAQLDINGKMNHYSSNDNNDSFLSSAFNRLMTYVAFDKEMKKFMALATHYSIQGIISEILGIVEIAAMGRYMGIRAVSAYIVVGTVTGFTGTITTGFYECTGVLLPQANGARNNLLVGRYMQLGIIFYLITALPSAVFWSFFTDNAVSWYKFDDETAQMAQVYLYATLPGYVTYGIDAVLWEFLNVMGYESYATWFTLISGVIHTGLVVGMLYLGFTDLYYLGLLETFSDVVCLGINFFLMYRNGWLDPYWEGLIKTNGVKDWRAVVNVVNTALPLSFAWVLTYGEWEIMTLFCRSMGDTGAEVVAWGLMGYLWSAFETLTDGFGDAAEVRVGFRMGAGQVGLAKLSMSKALYVCLTIALYSTGLLFVLAMYVPGWLTPDQTIQKMLFDIIPLVGFGQIWMVWGMVAWAILGAQGRIRTATILEFFISWGIGVPIAAIFVYVFNYNIEGIIGGLTISYTVGTNVYLYMLYTSDWESLSANVVAQNTAAGRTYQGFDWSDLPDNIREAAVELGYNKPIWESDDLEPESDQKEWDALSAKERKAALVLGYTKSTWNGDVEPVVRGNNISETSSDSNETWVNLSKEAQDAAKVLGYTQAIWDNDGSPPTEDLDWDQLSPAERKAAKTLGYTKNRWDGEDDDSDSLSYRTPQSDSNNSIYGTPMTTEGTSALLQPDSKDSSTSSRGRNNNSASSRRSTVSVSSKGGVLDKIIASCSFDASNESGTEHSKSSIPSSTRSVTDSISNKITSLLGLADQEAPEDYSAH